MNLLELHHQNVISEFWDKLEENLIFEESESLSSLLPEADKYVFNRFRISKNDKQYFIAGSARLHLYPELKEVLGISNSIGDLDLVIPDKRVWYNSGLRREWENKGIYKPRDSRSIEVFNEWKPQLSGEEYISTKVRPTKQILSDSTQISGYYFMSLSDIIDYKTSLNRDKEKEIVELIYRFHQSKGKDRVSFLRKIVETIGIVKTKEFLGAMS